MTAGDRIKLQFVLHPASAGSVDRAALEARMQGLGMDLTGLGLASASAEIGADSYRLLWGEPPATHAGFDEQASGPEMAVPEALKSDIKSISLVPRHVHFNKGRNP